MNRWVKKIAVVTGASAGIGAAIAKDLAKAGMIVVGLARRVEKVEELKNDLPEDVRQNLHSAKCDVMKEEEIIKTFAWIVEKFGGVDVLINNAGFLDHSVRLIDEENSSTILNTIHTNILGLIFCTREAFKSMKKRCFAGHVINVNSISGHSVPQKIDPFTLNAYPASKFAMTALTEMYRQEFSKENFGVRVTSVSPGIVRTEMAPIDSPIGGMFPFLEVQDVCDALRYALATPPRVNVQEIMLKPLGADY
ncbi:farnesol dehydrogenase-like [Phlebotomus argentipes]|uniref:farnesol dehydrogenase-like n=1 Tax=Phlebotomus argentipes TaxID=94469 RepID=UPI0028930299|nr:farnesol dehydrogenase-like [Phlebotomus argentipes]